MLIIIIARQAIDTTNSGPAINIPIIAPIVKIKPHIVPIINLIILSSFI